MDHLPLPIDSLAHSPLQVPYFGSKSHCYDDLGFLTYPGRVGVDVSRLLAEDRSYLSLEDLCPFLQEWLWFGLLGETLGIGSRVHIPQRIASRAAFIMEEKDGSKIIRTAELRRCILLASTKNQTSFFNDFHRSRYELCVQQALELVNCMLSKWPSKGSTMPHPLFLLLLSIQVLGETLLASREILFTSHRWRLAPMSSFLQPQATEIVDHLLVSAGWCPYDIGKIPAQAALRYYLSFIDMDRHLRNHSACSRVQCVLPLVPDSIIHPVHTGSYCLCEEITASEEQIINITGKGQVPLITFSEQSEGKRQLNMLSYALSEPRKFIAISHVRSKGLGNSSNALPYCQLSLIQTIADDLTVGSEAATPFWIDTMCIPQRREARKRCLSQVRQIHQQASKVVVLDPSLYRYSVGSSQEALLRIRYSSWAKRLWTIQEGALAQSLCFKFANCFKLLEDLLANHEKTPDIFLFVRHKTALVPYWLDLKLLFSLLLHLDNDIKEVDIMLSNVKQPDIPYDKQKLRTILRLGYLASPRFCFMVGEDEAWKWKIIIDVLSQVYVGHENVGISGSQTGMTRTTGMTEILRRLRIVAGVDLESKAKAHWE